MTKASKLLTLLLMTVFLVSCSSSAASRLTDEKLLPIQKVIDCTFSHDGKAWRSAFFPDYDEKIAKQYIDWGDCTDFNAYISEKLAFTLDADELNYGENIAIEYIPESVNVIDPADYPSYFADYDDISVYGYRLDVSSIEEAVAVNGTVNIRGDKSSVSREGFYILVKTGGSWYIHPIYYFLMF